MVVSSPSSLPTIALVGLPGSGKSTLGVALAQQLGLPFVDADLRIEAQAGQPITTIFAERGEPAFRALEHTTIAELLAHGPQVLGTGGGAFVQPNTQALLLAQALVVWLQAPLELLEQRVVGHGHRPLLASDPIGKLHSLATDRTPHYAKAPLHFMTSQASPTENAARLAAQIMAHLPTHQAIGEKSHV